MKPDVGKYLRAKPSECVVHVNFIKNILPVRTRSKNNQDAVNGAWIE